MHIMSLMGGGGFHHGFASRGMVHAAMTMLTAE